MMNFAAMKVINLDDLYLTRKEHRLVERVLKRRFKRMSFSIWMLSFALITTMMMLYEDRERIRRLEKREEMAG